MTDTREATPTDTVLDEDSQILPSESADPSYPILEEQPSESIHNVPSLPNPLIPLVESYTYHSPLPTAQGPYILGVDEAGRGPVLGPLVYGIAYCAEEKEELLADMGFADSKTLTHERRANLLDALSEHEEWLGWSVRVLSPQSISADMLRHPPTNLNAQSRAATVHLISSLLSGTPPLPVSKIYVDALGPSPQYQSYLESLFPGIAIKVEPKADSKWTIVGAASVAAKVTRDAWIDRWVFEEREEKGGGQEDREMGSGYPSDPNTKAWLKRNLERTFGFPSIVRFSWGTVKNILDEKEYTVEWIDETQTGLIKAFESATGVDKGRCVVARELSVHSVTAANL